MQRPLLSAEVIKALNFHAIACLHAYAGQYRPCRVTVGEYEPPDHHRVPALMDDCINIINRSWEKAEPVALAAYTLWSLNSIHPFVNGNGRTARAACHFVLCLKLGIWLPGTVILPELIRQNRDDYVAALKAADESAALGNLDFSALHTLLTGLIEEQLKTAASESPPS